MAAAGKMDERMDQGDLLDQEPFVFQQEPFLGIDYSKRVLSAVTSLTAQMSQASSRNEVLELVAIWTPTIIPADRASITFPSDADHLEVFALEGNKAIPIGVQLPIDCTTTGLAYRDKRAINIGHTAARTEVDTKMLAGKGLMSCLNAPIMTQGHVIGALNVAHRKPGAYKEEHEALLLHVAGIVAAQLTLLDRFFGVQERLEAEVVARTKELECQKEQLKCALEKEREFNGLQRQFVAMVSHEFRTPLAIIDGNAQRLNRWGDKVSPDRLEGATEKIRTAVSRLTNLIESVLSVAQLENEAIELNPRLIDICDLIADVCADHQEVSPDHHLATDMPEHLVEACVDENLIQQVISNLVSNAIKYSPGGTKIWVRADIDEESGVTLSVEDDGPGIPLTEQDKLFDRFFRGATSTGIIGAGTGLHMAKVLVELHGGDIDVESVEGEGTTFTVYLPVHLHPLDDAA